ncbi:hypothetical protein FCV25MIE_15357 [Fagus crenata]|jgi:hypothetical protein
MDARRLMDFAFECLNITRDEEGNLIHIDAAEVFNVMNSLRVKKANKVKSFLRNLSRLLEEVDCPDFRNFSLASITSFALGLCRVMSL